MKEKTKNKKGITLIALVVTIVVLLILAGVTINFVLGNSGILQQAKNAQNVANSAVQTDIATLQNVLEQLDSKVNASRENVTLSKQQLASIIETSRPIGYGDRVDLKGYTAQNQYEVPEDGIIILRKGTSAQECVCNFSIIRGDDEEKFAGNMPANSANIPAELHVFKGDKISVKETSNLNYVSFYYRPYIYPDNSSE